MCVRPNPNMRKGAAGNDTPKRSQSKIEPHQLSEAACDLQAEKLRRLYSFCKATACTVASLAFGCAR
jgi:hypothetical protein